MKVTAEEFAKIHSIVFREGYPGYRPNVVELPNGDGNADTLKRYAHISEKYIKEMNSYDRGDVRHLLEEVTDYARGVAVELGIPSEFWPVYEYSTIRVLEYPPGATSAPHTDFDLFTLNLYRNFPENLRVDVRPAYTRDGGSVHYGELLELIHPNYFATEHSVSVDLNGRTQYSMIYFAIPDHAAVLPSGETVGAWLEERIARSRKEKEQY